jgi:hypothetical protein
MASVSTVWAVGQSAVITLVFPPGARATGLGEAFVGLSDDANATFFNPAGLGLEPLSNSWKAYPAQNNVVLTAIASKRKKEFGSSDKIWAGTAHGILRYNGKSWETYERHLIGQGESLHDIVRKYLPIDNDQLVQKAEATLKTANGIELKRTKALETYLTRELSDSVLKAKSVTVSSLSSDIMGLSKAERSSTKIYGILASKADSLKANAMSDTIEKILSIEDTKFDDLVELKIPFTIAVDDSVTTLVVDSLERLWVGTPHGLWRYDGSVWNYFSTTEGLPSNLINGISTSSNGDIAVATDKGIGLFAEGKWKSFGRENGLPDSFVTSVAFGKDNVLYAGTFRGLAKKKDSTWTVMDTANGLLSPEVRTLYFDSQNKLWIGGRNGVSLFDEASWKRYKFPGSTVSSIIEHAPGTVWIGTDKGVVVYTKGKSKINAAGQPVEGPPEWKVFHSKNALKGDDIQGIAVQGRDIWLATPQAVNHYHYAEREVLLFYEQLLPAFKIPDLWHFYLAFVQPTEEWGTIGFSVNFINFGSNELTDEQGKIKGIARSWEGVFGLSYGLQLAHDFAGGINIKYAHSALAPGIGSGDEGIGRTFAIDVGLLKRNFFLKNFDLGFVLQNMGPSIFYVEQKESDPIPFTVKLGFVYRAIQTSFHDLKILLDFNREIVHKDPGQPPDPFYKAIFTGFLNDNSTTFRQKLEAINVNSGIEYWYANFLALRIGNLFDVEGKRFELTLGMGLRYGNMNFDWSFIHSPEGFMQGIVSEGSNGSRNGQWRASFIFKF